jgi:hypothetical protein
MGRSCSLAAHIHNPVLNAGLHTPEKNAFQPPVRQIDRFLLSLRGVREQVMKEAFMGEERLYPAESAGEESIGLLESCGRPALRTLVFDQDLGCLRHVRGFIRVVPIKMSCCSRKPVFTAEAHRERRDS